MAAVKINQFETTCVRINIPCDIDPRRGATDAQQVASILRQLAERFEQGKNPMNFNTDSVDGASVDYL